MYCFNDSIGPLLAMKQSAGCKIALAALFSHGSCVHIECIHTVK